MSHFLTHNNALLLVLAATLLNPLQGDESHGLSKQSKSHEYIEVELGATVEANDICRDLAISITSNSDKIIVSTEIARISISLEEHTLPDEIIVGDFWHNGRCFAAVKSSVRFVNESFDLYRLGQEVISPSTHNLINPEFSDEKVINTYRDAARWHREVICYSETQDRPYICSQRDDLDDDIQRLISCDENDVCTHPLLVYKGTNEVISAAISVERAYIFRKNENGRLYKSPAYLILNDRVTLTDFLEDGPHLYFRIEFHGEDRITTGWIIAENISLETK